MADSILRLRVDSAEYNNKLKQATNGLTRYVDECRKVGGTLEVVEKETLDYVRAIGQMDTTSRTATGKLAEMKKTFVELSAQYKQMSDAEKNAPFGKALAASLDQLKPRINEVKQQLDDINKSMIGASSGGGGLFGGGKLDGMLQVFGGNLMTKAAGMAASFAAEIGDCVKQGIELAKQGEGIRIAFERLGRGDILDGLREATHGTVTDLELMKAAVKFNDFKLPVEELGTMLAFAQQKAKDTGQSIDYMVDSIVTGLGRKSLMILDNLGLSATEVKDRMKETGDMTKAVGEIIREQMAKAGDYVETAADRAAKANVSLQNKMEELGRKFAPLQEASNNFWTSMKIGIMDVVGGPLTDLLNKLTEAGRLMNAYGKIGGNAKVGRMTSNLANASEGNRQSIYQQQQEQFWRYINPREQQIQDIQRWQRGERGEALQSRISAITEKYGSLDATKIRAEVDAAKKMLADYQQAAKSILQPIKQEITPTLTTPSGSGKGGSTTVKTEEQLLNQNIQELTQEYLNASAERQAAIRDEINGLQDQLAVIQQLKDEATGKRAIPGGMSIVGTEGFNGFANETAILEHAKTVVLDTITPFDQFTQHIEYLKGILNDPPSIEVYKMAREELEKTEAAFKEFKGEKTETVDKNGIEGFAGDFAKVTGSVSSIASGLQSLGVEIPDGLAKTIAVVQTISGILTAILAITTAIQATSSVNATASVIDAVVPFARGGKVPKAASGYYVPGRRTSGDTTPILANAGELVLNKSSQSNLAAMIRNAESLVGMIDRYQNSFLSRAEYGSEAANFSGGAMSNLNLSATLTGEQIRLVLNNNGRRTGRGEYVTSNFTRG